MSILTGIYSEAIPGELAVLPGFITGSHNINIGYIDDILLIDDKKNKLKKSLQNVIKEK